MNERPPSWFVWRFSLGRLVLAVVFLGAFVGLNMREIGPRVQAYTGELYGTFAPSRNWGWPLPFMAHMEPEVLTEIAKSYQLPLTHQTYRLVNLGARARPNTRKAFIFWGGAIDTLFVVGMLFLILPLHLRQPSIRMPRLSVLSVTLAVLLLLSVVYLNLRPSPIGIEQLSPPTTERIPLVFVQYDPTPYLVSPYGWPFVACKACREKGMTRTSPDPEVAKLIWQEAEKEYRWQWLGFVGNLLIGLVVVIGGGATCEFLVRRRTEKAET